VYNFLSVVFLLVVHLAHKQFYSFGLVDSRHIVPYESIILLYR